MSGGRTGPLAGLKVVELQGLGPAPLAGQLMADLGADVVLITRASGPADPTDLNTRGKRSMALNLKSPDGVAVALDLIARSDVLMEGFRPGVTEKMGLGPEACHARNPTLIYGRMTGWGQEGPLSQTAGHDINYLGVTGFLNAVGPAEAPPPVPLNIGADYAGGTMFLLLGIMAALYERQSSGQGQVIDAAMVDGASALMALMHSFIARGQWSEARNANLLDGGAPFYRTYECADGRYLAVGSLEPQFFAELVRLAGLPEDHRATQMDAAEWPARHEAYAEVFRQKSRDDWAAIFEGTDACVSPVLSWSEAPEHPHLAARQTFVSPGGITQAAPAPRFSRTPAGTVGQPPAPGGDTDQILTDLGYDADAIARLRTTGTLT